MPPLTPSRRGAFIAITVLFTCVAGLFACELILRWRHSVIQNSNQLDPAIFRPDPVLGWRLNPGASGLHKHYDFTAEYHIDASGSRVSLPPAASAKSNVVILGDSFTFGLGVNDSETFSSRLNQAQSTFKFINYGLPGSSTDQQFLLLQQRISRLAPAEVLLVLYLGNDIFDNARTYPLQLNQPKPVFSLDPSGELVLTEALHNKERRPSESLPDLIFGKHHFVPPRFPLFPQTFETLGLVDAPLESLPFSSEDFLQRHQDSLELTREIIRKMRDTVEKSGAGFRLLLLAGRSFVETPASTSAQFQNIFRISLLQFAEAEEISCFDASTHLQNHFKSKPLFFPHDGHLNVRGHQVLADFIKDSLADPNGE